MVCLIGNSREESLNVEKHDYDIQGNTRYPTVRPWKNKLTEGLHTSLEKVYNTHPLEALVVWFGWRRLASRHLQRTPGE